MEGTPNSNMQCGREVYDGFDIEEFRKNGHLVIDWMAEYYKNLQNESIKVRPDVKPGFLTLDTEALVEGKGFASGMAEFNEKVMPGVLHWQHPKFMSYFPCSLSFPALLGNLVGDAINTPNFSWTCNPAAAEMEVIVMNFLTEQFGLPMDRFGWHTSGSKGGGFIQYTATAGMIVSIRAARDRKETEYAKEHHTDEDIGGRLVAYTSETAHFCAEKAATVACIKHFRKVPCPWNEEKKNWVLDIASLRKLIEEDLKNGLIPFFLSISVGSTGTGTIDCTSAAADIAEEYNLWYTVDGAYAGVTALLPECKQHFVGWERADTIIVNGSKWFASLFNTSFMWASDTKQISICLSHTGTYLKSGGPKKILTEQEEEEEKKQAALQEEKEMKEQREEQAAAEYIPVDFKDLQLDLGRNWRSLKIWWMLHSMGIEGVKAMIRRHIALAKDITKKLEETKLFDVVTATEFGLVCFRPLVKNDDDIVNYLNQVNGTRETFMVHSTAGGRPIIRLVVCHPLFTEKDSDCIIDLLITEAKKFGIPQL